LLYPLHGIGGNFIKFGFIIFVFPGLVYFGAGAIEKIPSLGKLLGDVSYGVYTIHIPLLVIMACGLRVLRKTLTPVNTVEFISLETSFVVFILGLALVLDTKVDRPFRKSLLTWTKSGERLTNTVQRSGGIPD
jgi:peptidoglycan/LPS O-acetylase OafA/YrhL